MKTYLLILVMAICTPVWSQTADKLKAFNVEDQIAIQGYDPVAYFTDNQARKGKKDIAAKFEGILYYFASVAHRDLFLKNPKNYEPQYGGWCAYAMGANGEKVEINPETFKIIDGKLFLFYNAFFNNTLKSWNKNEAALRRKADQNWSRFFTVKS
jgi:YHS domain-containing protein